MRYIKLGHESGPAICCGIIEYNFVPGGVIDENPDTVCIECAGGTSVIITGVEACKLFMQEFEDSIGAVLDWTKDKLKTDGVVNTLVFCNDEGEAVFEY